MGLRKLALLSLLLSSLHLSAASYAVSPPGVKLSKAAAARDANNADGDGTQLGRRDINPAVLYPANKFSALVDNFHNVSTYEPHSDNKFDLRYFFDASHFKPGGPVIVMLAGERDASQILYMLQKGNLQQMINATNGLGVILEHRYYGQSFPVPDLSTKNMRFLSTEQSLADMAYFAQNIKYKGLEKTKLTSNDVPYFLYGGSYAGALAAFGRATYPNVFYGAIASSAPVQGINDFWQYFDSVRQDGPQDCMRLAQNLTRITDATLTNGSQTGPMKKLFGLGDVSADDDFSNALTAGVGAYQQLNWVPSLNDTEFGDFCSNITHASNVNAVSMADMLTVKKILAISDANDNVNLTIPFLNYASWINATNSAIVASQGISAARFFNSRNASAYTADLSYNAASFRSWDYQTCTQWSHYLTGSGSPTNIQPIISRRITVDYVSLKCQYSFNITTLPDPGIINRQYGGDTMSYDRLAFVDGSKDAWLPSSVHADSAAPRNNSDLRPSFVIQGAGHHWEMYGIFANESAGVTIPSSIKDAQTHEINIISTWLKQWTAPK